MPDTTEAEHEHEEQEERETVTPETLKKRDAALLAQMKRMNEQSTQMITTTLQQFIETVKPSSSGDGQPPQDEMKAKMSAMEKTMEKLKAERDEERAARERETQARLRDERRTQLVAHGRRVGMTNPELIEAFADRYLNRVQHDENGRIVFCQDEYETKPLSDAIDELAKGPLKAYIAPVGASGSGTRGVKSGTNGKPSKLPSRIEMEQILGQQLGWSRSES